MQSNKNYKEKPCLENKLLLDLVMELILNGAKKAK